MPPSLKMEHACAILQDCVVTLWQNKGDIDTAKPCVYALWRFFKPGEKIGRWRVEDFNDRPFHELDSAREVDGLIDESYGCAPSVALVKEINDSPVPYLGTTPFNQMVSDIYTRVKGVAVNWESASVPVSRVFAMTNAEGNTPAIGYEHTRGVKRRRKIGTSIEAGDARAG